MATKLKSKILSYNKLWEVLEKSVLIIFILIVIVSFAIISNLQNLRISNNQMSNLELRISESKERLEEVNKSEKNDNDTNWITYDLWLSKCATTGNSYLYDNTNFLKLLSEKTQEELNKVSAGNKTLKKQVDYNNIVKFIVIDKSKNTFLTNDINNIKFIKDNLKLFSKESGELFKYVSNIGKWYNITYTSQTAPAYKYQEGYEVENPNNFVEAYWFPKDYKYLGEDEVIIRNILENEKLNQQNIIKSSNEGIVSVKSNLVKYKISILIYLVLIMIMILALYFLSKERIIRGMKESFVVKIVQNIDRWLGNRSTLFKLTVFFLFTLSVLLMFIVLISSSSLTHELIIMFILWILFYLIAIFPRIFKFSKYIDEITDGIEKITSGDLDHFIEEKGDNSLSRLAYNINKLNKGFKVSIEDQIKNEKLKSELVANVSHDLKTPLTSIINYTDILLRENISEEEKIKYLNILNRKGLKLKSLIEDLFEISKINSGKVELNMENVDLIELASQAIAEYSDSEIYSDKNLIFIFKPYTTKIELNLDGKNMSRVFENLINNALKYSLNNTRVFIEIEEVLPIRKIKKGIKISFKNTSSTALDFHKEEIFERFTRGDKSRNSNIDGNGLGLAIAKSIVELHDGKMYIDFDGDMFKVIIELYY
ncbi:HAMP domain-containing histidine kinase [Clostridium sp. CS001]|uniref:sensor histidine kinase n=1 Tax=Clostridium sp. CS001 TaxID=2880648 RepID=UPI001CF41841|nr:HAMP domain-containing sensor histidine kinase [Clostridium sp. CS001]MCB2291108.1 HAMP domain-containing histidine kinase [Clostridium sp. CS001]